MNHHHCFAGMNAGLEALGILREIRQTMPWMPQVPSEAELLQLPRELDVIDNDEDCIDNGIRI
jgi:hypothetical protein